MIEKDRAWNDYRERFASVYDDANYGSWLQAAVMRKSHSLLEQGYDSQSHFPRVLEIGAGTGEHLCHIQHRFDEYIVSDLDPKALEIARERNALTASSSRILYSVQTANQLDFPDATFDRLIATHVLEHIPEPHKALWEWLRVLKTGGTLSILIPTDPGLAWRLGRTLGPRRQALAAGIAYDYIMAREHVNACHNLLAILRHFFPAGREQWWPLPIGVIDLNLFLAFNAIKSSE